MNGLGVDYDEEKAVEWLNKAAAQHYAQAQYNLGIYYAKFFERESVRQAVKWLNEAAKQDYADAQYNLAHLYLNPHHPASREQGAGRRTAGRAVGGTLAHAVHIGAAAGKQEGEGKAHHIDLLHGEFLFISAVAERGAGAGALVEARRTPYRPRVLDVLICMIGKKSAYGNDSGGSCDYL
jgi:TPR repeat protein